MQAPAEGDVQAIGREGNEDVRFDAMLELMEDRTDGEIAFEILERLLRPRWRKPAQARSLPLSQRSCLP